MIRNALFFFVYLLQIQSLFGAVSWSPPSLLSPAGIKCGTQVVSVNKHGNAIIGGVNRHNHVIELAEYHFALNKIDFPTITYPCSSKDVHLLKMVLLDNKDIFLLWEDVESTCLQASKYDRSQNIWVETLVVSSKGLYNPDLQVDAHGNAMLVWTRFDQYVHQIQAAYFSAQKNNWSSPTSISPVGYNCQSQTLGFDSHGNAIMCWSFDLYTERDKKNGTQGIQGKRFNANQEKWSPSLFISEFSVSDQMTHPNLIFDSKDNVYICWEYLNSYMKSKTIQYVYYNFGKEEFGNRTDIFTESSPYKSVLIKSNQRIFAFWQTNKFGQESLQSFQLNSKSSQQTPADVSIPLPIISHFNHHTNETGKITVAFSDHEHIKIAQLGDAWQDIGEINNQKDISDLQIEVDALGNALIVWEKDNQVYYSRGNSLLSPPSFSARKLEKQFVTKKIFHIVLNWEHPQSPSLIGYKIRKNDILIAELPACQTLFIDPAPLLNGHTIYSITSVNDQRMESQSNELTVTW